MTHEHPRTDRLFEIGSAYRQAKVLLSAVELGVFSELAAGPLDARDLASRIRVHGRSARDFFDALVATGLLTRDDEGRYRNTEESDFYLDRAKPTYLGASFDQYNRREYVLWGSLTQSLQTGNPAAETHGQDHFGSLYNDAARFRTFVTAMTSGSLLAAQGIAHQFPWENYQTLCDVGTAQGCLPVQVALAHPHVRAIGFDLPMLCSAFEEYAVERNVADRVSFAGGDFFKDPLPQADVIVLGRVLHNWDLEAKKMLLDEAYRSIPTGGAVIVYDMLIDDDRRTSTTGLLSSLNMLLWTAGGFGYTATDCTGWMRSAGFTKTTVRHLPGGNSMIIGEK
ncbi:methyltransferase [Bradyrhizobium canariense]|uniref:methyltransferase n=1 Tax=Bradyrhizobium canariense TaxID=255045 RepID=UPI001B8A6FB0|nr:methyltransferase [Bradyrhizobium canariense]MBR0950378.1 methyltransferase [Bradyrhizobium canariense]